ncbi:CheR family methyltransferase [Dermatophilus congolensis]|uniref:protein-glutamate O-methyltransferase n=1 Tax=Dermatophilus congolensis TaxID=1863 RepID=A0A239VVN6_9MICO|nr:protein-glutamate O-methyltransferase CheR [Dermatophilus congolensis]MBO3141194.1 protein-glutamate O-methyltransferase CheR [Dermatophilus congolensis]MBO3143405.1 protein-glutamate O-methyltransferase CheR [Dermatophilus congolensis]MBO3147897.1 protein-glutamate O-methyltransferase CheR [Dermatophilus congolensis]MBO3152395.1 protein-glutamate O-methyltransferase CheR [Dermatophilus congolensis]MBO3153759.1 protein-glutamate O-methyltransferase CheR [Dermatophilus congolensis]
MALNGNDLDFIATVVRERSAIVLDRSKEYLIESRLQTLARSRGDASVDDLIRKLRSAPKGPLRDEVIEAMTTNETSFFRDGHPFMALQNQILPELIVSRGRERTLNIWCAASSSGQEPYTIAMLIQELIGADPSWRVRLLATDIDTQMLKRTRDGIYNQFEVNRGLPAPLLVRYFARHGMQYQVDSRLRAMVETKFLNLSEPLPPMPSMDIIFLRNVLIYFDVDMKRQILQGARKIIKPDGYLFLGGAETTMNIDNSWKREMIGRATVYRPD